MSDEDRMYKVLVNDEEQHSLWPQAKEVPRGWRDTGKSGTQEECLAYVREVWTDIRPLSLRQALRSAEQTEAIET